MKTSLVVLTSALIFASFGCGTNESTSRVLDQTSTDSRVTFSCAWSFENERYAPMPMKVGASEGLVSSFNIIDQGSYAAAAKYDATNKKLALALYDVSGIGTITGTVADLANARLMGLTETSSETSQAMLVVTDMRVQVEGKDRQINFFCQRD